MAASAGHKRRRADDDDGHDKALQINVGGRVFLTSRATLCSQPGSMLAALFDADSNFQRRTVDDEGRAFLDRNSDLFHHVLEFLRSGRFSFPTYLSSEPSDGKPARREIDLITLANLFAEAEYFGLDQMVQTIRVFIRRQGLTHLMELGLTADLLKQVGFSAHRLMECGFSLDELYPLCSTAPVEGLPKGESSRTAESMPLVIVSGEAGRSKRLGLMRSIPRAHQTGKSDELQMVWTKIPRAYTAGSQNPEPANGNTATNGMSDSFGDLCKISDILGSGGGVRYLKFAGDPTVGRCGRSLHSSTEWYKLAE